MHACGTTLNLLQQVIAASHVGNDSVALNFEPFDHPHGETVPSRQEPGLSFCEAIWPSPNLIYARGIPTLQLNTPSLFAGKLRKPSQLKEPSNIKTRTIHGGPRMFQTRHGSVLLRKSPEMTLGINETVMIPPSRALKIIPRNAPVKPDFS
jgi:hypothetical protein